VQDLALSDGRPLWQHVASSSRVGRGPRRRARPLERRRRRRRDAPARGRRGAAAAAAGDPAPAGRRRAGRDLRPTSRAPSRAARRARSSPQRDGDDRRRPRCTPGTTCSATFPGVIGVKTGHTSRPAGARSPRRAARRHVYATILGSPTARSGTPTSPRCCAGALALPPRPVGAAGRVYAKARSATGRAGRARRAAALIRAPCASTAARRARRRARRGRAARSQGQRARRGPVYHAGQALVARAARRLAHGRGRRRSAASASTPAAYPPPHGGGWFSMIVTVTLNAAIDRTLTVPNFQRGQRHRASQG
jgi:hypothetical protein